MSKRSISISMGVELRGGCCNRVLCCQPCSQSQLHLASMPS